MKKLLLSFFVMAFAIVLVACGGTTTEAPTTDAPTTVAPTTVAPTTAGPTTVAPTTDAPTTEAPKVPIYEDRVINDTYTLLLQSSVMDGIFSPFFYSSAYDGDVVGLTHAGLLTLDPTGAVVAGEDYPVLAESYSIKYTDNLDTLASKESYEEGDYVVYEIALKNGAKFSDGTLIDADDVLFNYYVYLDPSYNGSSTLYTLPILGLKDYRTQGADAAVVNPIFDAILAADERVSGYTTNATYTEAQHDVFWESIDFGGEMFAKEIVAYVKNNYGNNYVQAYFSDNTTWDEIAGSPGLSVAYGMGMWGYGEISEDLLTFTGASGTEYVTEDLTYADYFAEILLANTDPVTGKLAFDGGYQGLSDYESAGNDFVAIARDKFLSLGGDIGSVPNITGLRKGTTTIDDVEYETVIVILTEQNPKAILSLGVTVAPQHYYTAGYTYPAGNTVNYGVEWNSASFMNHLHSFNGAPMGAGSHKFMGVDPGDSTVYFERNTYFETMGGLNVYNSNIKNIALKIVSSGAEYSALQAGDVHYATVSATGEVMENVTIDDLYAILVDNLGYGYVLVNPQVYPNLNFRIALTTVFDLTTVLNYYPNGLADIIYRSQSQVSWAYPEGAEAIYPFDETLVSAIAYFEAAGVEFTEGVVSNLNGNLGSAENPIEFTLPSGTESHPAGGIFLKAQTLLQSLGFVVEVKTDTSLIANIKLSPVGVYALAWQSSADPDMYQVNHYESQADSVIANGIAWLHENGNDDALGTIDVVKMDGTEVTMNQTEALEYLAELIELGTKYMLPEERKPIYAKALEILAQLNIEVPTYQRKNLFVLDPERIDQTTVSTTITPYWGPLAEIWKLSFAEGVPYNQTVQGVVGYED